MGLIEKLRQELAAKEQEQQARLSALSEEEALHKQRRDQAVAFQTESGVGDLVRTTIDLLRKTRHPNVEHFSIPGSGFQDEIDSVFNGIKWDWEHLPGEVENGYTYYYVNVATRPSGVIVFYSSVTTLVQLAEWRTNKGILEKTLELALDAPRFEIRQPKNIDRRVSPGKTFRAEF